MMNAALRSDAAGVRADLISPTVGGRVFPRRFALVRHVDYTGISGIGVVAYGVVFFDGQVALRWCSTHPATSLWNSVDDLLAVHGHGSATSVQWLDRLDDAFQAARSALGAGLAPRPQPPEPPATAEPDGRQPESGSVSRTKRPGRRARRPAPADLAAAASDPARLNGHTARPNGDSPSTATARPPGRHRRSKGAEQSGEARTARRATSEGSP